MAITFERDPSLTQPIGTLLAGTRLVLDRPDRMAALDFLECSSGITRASDHYQQLPYRAGAFVPRLPWRAPTASELEVLVAPDARIDQRAQWLQVIDLPASVYECFQPMRAAAAAASSVVEVKRHRDTDAGREMIEHATAWAESIAWPHTPIVRANLYVTEPGLPTSTHEQEPTLIGLHVDSTFHLPLRRRDYSPVRLCANVGTADRFFLYINLRLPQIESLLNERGIAEHRDLARSHAFRDAFMRHWPDYPVVKLRIHPGEAYIAQTENLIHDGSTLGQRGFDLAFMADGFFTLTSADAAPCEYRM